MKSERLVLLEEVEKCQETVEFYCKALDNPIPSKPRLLLIISLSHHRHGAAIFLAGSQAHRWPEGWPDPLAPSQGDPKEP